MSKVVTSTKPDKLGTYGRKQVNCIFDGTTMTEYNTQEITPEIEQIILRCPVCGWLATFITRKE